MAVVRQPSPTSRPDAVTTLYTARPEFFSTAPTQKPLSSAEAVAGHALCGRQHGYRHMQNSVFLEDEFFLLLVISIIVPVGMYGYMMWKRSISRKTVLLFGSMLIAIAGVTIFLLQHLADMAKASPSVLDDRFFASVSPSRFTCCRSCSPGSA